MIDPRQEPRLIPMLNEISREDHRKIQEKIWFGDMNWIEAHIDLLMPEARSMMEQELLSREIPDVPRTTRRRM
jgi:hypothetical protein